MKREKIVLSDRLEAVASFVSEGYRVCDVGCDHGFVPIYLVQQGISPKALAMDARKGPLEAAREHITAHGLDVYIETRLSDGLADYRIGEADTLICAGMGGRLMMRILQDGAAKTDSFRELILQPQSDIQEFRAFLRRQGYVSVDENIIEEDGKFYPMMKVSKVRAHSEEDLKRLQAGICAEAGRQDEAVMCDENAAQGLTVTQWERFDAEWLERMEDRYGALLLRRKHPVLYRYLEREMRICMEVMDKLQEQGLTGDKQKKRYEEIERQCRDGRRVVEEIFGGGH